MLNQYNNVNVPLISIITPVYNMGKVLPYCIDSVLNQTHKNFEFILIDDNSTDETPFVIDYYSKLDNRIKILRNQYNSRKATIPWEPRNDGLKVAQGEYIAYLDADNTWNPDFLKKLLFAFSERKNIQLVHCDSRNHYSGAEAKMVIAEDSRNLVDFGSNWTVFSYNQLDSGLLGNEQYIDTNEIMHRSSIFGKLRSLWHTSHPKRDWVNANQGKICSYRRHNDLDLVERTIEEFGLNSIYHLPEVHTNYFYPSAKRPLHPVFSQITKIKKTNPLIHPTILSNKELLNIPHFYEDYIQRLNLKDEKVLDLSIGELKYDPAPYNIDIWTRFLTEGYDINQLTQYGGTRKLNFAFENLASYYNNLFQVQDIDKYMITAFDGCHNALYSAISLVAGTSQNIFGRHKVVFPVPSYPYWNIIAAARSAYISIYASNGRQFISQISSLEDKEIASLIIPYPSNPLGFIFTKVELEEIYDLAQKRNWAIIIDISSANFISSPDALHTLTLFDKSRTIICDSISKGWGLPGLRLGFAICFDKDLSASVRAIKSSQSLLPSGLKQSFFSYLITNYPEIPKTISNTIDTRRRNFQNSFINKNFNQLGIKLFSQQESNHNMYEVLLINELCKNIKQSPSELAKRLFIEQNIKVSTSETYFPNKNPKNAEDNMFFRISLGKYDDFENTLNLIYNFIKQSLLK